MGQTIWEVVDFSSSLVSQSDVDAIGATAGQLLVSDGNGKWNAQTIPTLPPTSTNEKLQFLQSDGTTFVHAPVRFPSFAEVQVTGSALVTHAHDFAASNTVQQELTWDGWFLGGTTGHDHFHLHLVMEIGGVSVDFSTTTSEIPDSYSHTNFGNGGVSSSLDNNSHIKDGHGPQIVYHVANYKVHSGIPGWVNIKVRRLPNNWYIVQYTTDYQSSNYTPMTMRGLFSIDHTSRPNERITKFGIACGVSGQPMTGQHTVEWR